MSFARPQNSSAKRTAARTSRSERNLANGSSVGAEWMNHQSAVQNAILFQLTFDTSVPNTEKRFDRGADFIERRSAKLSICATYDTIYAGFDPTVASYVSVTTRVRLKSDTTYGGRSRTPSHPRTLAPSHRRTHPRTVALSHRRTVICVVPFSPIPLRRDPDESESGSGEQPGRAARRPLSERTRR